MRQSSFRGFDFFVQAKRALGSRFIQTAFLGFALLWNGNAAQAQTLASLPSASQPIQNSGNAKPILGWVRFCEQTPAECTFNPSESRVIALTPQTWNTIVSVNKRVNSEIKPVTDQDHWGVVDTWGMPDDGKGDCEDFQLLKRHILADAGLPRRAMRMTVVIDELGEGHAVLMIRTDKGDYILDNKTSAILSWDETGYSYVKRESQEVTGWVSLGGITRSPTTTANR
jgi:predicted transglutaminase-like cysteine proteinase